MPTSILQPSFASGELAPALAARVDITRYYTGLKLCRNFYVMPYGGVRNRPGTRFVDETKDNGLARLIRFKFSNADSYALEFTNLLMRVYRNGVLVLNTSGPDIGLPFELVTPYTAAQLSSLNFTQSADVMTFAHIDHKPQELRRLGHDNWTMAPVSLVPSIVAPATATATPATGTSTNLQSWAYQVTAVLDDGNSIEESLPATSNTVTVKGDAQKVDLVWDAVVGATYYNVYKDNSVSGVFGFAGRATTATFTDNNINAIRTDTPPNGQDPFIGAGNYPGAVGYYKQRLVFGGTENKPQTNWFSKVAVFSNYGYSVPSKDDDSIIYTQASLEVERIRHYLPLRSLLVLTTGAEWEMQGAATGLTPRTIASDAQSYNGCSDVPPIVINSTVIYVQARGNSVASLSYTLEDDGFGGDDLTILSSHLFRGFTITDWAYQQKPDSVVWCVRSDGALLGLTFVAKQQVVAWHQHTTDGWYESVCTLPEGGEDVLYAVVRREINGVTKRYVERFASRQLSKKADGSIDIAQCYFVDCGLSYQGWNAGSATRTLTGGTLWQYPELLTCTDSSGAGFVVGDVGNHVHFVYLDDDGLEQVLRTEITAYIGAGSVTVRPIGQVPVSLRGVATTRWGDGVDQLSGLDHLEGKAVSILADGNVVGGLTVTAGSITLATPSVVIHVGLGYVSDLETLAINLQNQETIFDKNKMIPSVTLLVEESRGIFVGKDADSLNELKQRNAEDYNDPTALLTGTAKVIVTTNWKENGRVYVRQVDPLPLTILGIIPEIETGGKS